MAKNRKSSFSFKFSLLLLLMRAAHQGGCDKESPRATEWSCCPWLAAPWGSFRPLHILVCVLPCTFWCMFSFSVILWLGDLNYRLEELDVAKVKQLVEEKAFVELCQYDQVLISHLPWGCSVQTTRLLGLFSAQCLPFIPHGNCAWDYLKLKFLSFLLL